jgi:hypothetical protein
MQGQTLHIRTQDITMWFRVQRTTQTRAQIHLKFALKLMGKHLQLSYIPNKETVDTTVASLNRNARKTMWSNQKCYQNKNQQSRSQEYTMLSERCYLIRGWTIGN